MQHLLENLVLGSFLVAIITLIHFVGLTLLTAFVHKSSSPHGRSAAPVWKQGLSIIGVVMGLFLFHTLEIWVFAVVYILLGQFSSLEEALYFSTSTFTTVGFGDIVLEEWRMLAAIESAAGFLMIGWSTAFLVSLTAKVRVLEAAFESHSNKNEE